MHAVVIPAEVSPGLWTLAWRRLREDRVAMIALTVLLMYLVTLVMSFAGILASDWEDEVAISYAPPSFVGAHNGGDMAPQAQSVQASAAPLDYYGIKDPLEKEMAEIRAELAKSRAEAAQEQRRTLPFGADRWGRDIIKKTIKGGETSIVVGLVAAVLATVLGTLFGALSGYYGKWIDDLFNWFYSIFTSVPYLLLILAAAAVLQQRGVLTIILILGLTGWTGTYRLIRAEYLKHKGREYVQAAHAIGVPNWRKMFVHIFPNVSHVTLVQLSILVVSFIKSEVILSFLGFGVPAGGVSWGSMLNEAQNELILGKWWQLTAATIAMAMLVTAFSLFTDALRDALDPRLVA